MKKLCVCVFICLITQPVIGFAKEVCDERTGECQFVQPGHIQSVEPTSPSTASDEQPVENYNTAFIGTFLKAGNKGKVTVESIPLTVTEQPIKTVPPTSAHKNNDTSPVYVFMNIRPITGFKHMFPRVLVQVKCDSDCDLKLKEGGRYLVLSKSTPRHRPILIEGENIKDHFIEISE